MLSTGRLTQSRHYRAWQTDDEGTGLAGPGNFCPATCAIGQRSGPFDQHRRSTQHQAAGRHTQPVGNRSFAPNSWFALNSHELLLNVSEDVATDEEFPVIQLADASGAIVIPHDLRRGFTELLINGFRLRPQTDDSILQEIHRPELV